MTIAVPFTRTLHRGLRGSDVKAVKRALVHQGVLKQKLRRVSGRYGLMTKRAVRRFQKHHGLHVDGVYGRKTHLALVAGRNFDRYGASLMRGWVEAHRPSGGGIVAAAKYGLAHAPRHYQQDYRRWQAVDRVPWAAHMWDYADCSSFATGCFKMAGLPDPNGLNYTAGYTGTLCQHGRAVSSPEPGDLVFYGSGAPWHHVAVYVGNGMVVGHGHEGGPFFDPIDYRSDRGQIRRYV